MTLLEIYKDIHRKIEENEYLIAIKKLKWNVEMSLTEIVL